MTGRFAVVALWLFACAGIDEDFSGGMERWWVEGGVRAWVESGRLYMNADPETKGPANAVQTVWHRDLQPSDFELELDSEVSSSSQNVNNINLFFSYTDPSGVPLEETRQLRRTAEYALYHQLNGYIITFLNDTEAPGSDRARIRIRRNPGFKLLAETFTYHCRAGVTYHLKVVKKGGEIRFLVDGKELLRALDPQPLGPGYFGLRTFRTKLWWDNIRLRAVPTARTAR